MSDDDIKIEEEHSGIKEKNKKLKEQLRKCLSERDEYLAGWQRAKADFINARREEDERRSEVLKHAEENLMIGILSVLDSFELAIGGSDWKKLDKNWQNGIKSMYNQLLGVLKTRNVEQINAKGAQFDPREHESLSEIDVDDKDSDGIVVEVVREGYKMGNKIIRPAQVKVGKYTNN